MKKDKIKLEYDEEYYSYLDELRRSGITNMWGAASYLKEEFDVDRCYPIHFNLLSH